MTYRKITEKKYNHIGNNATKQVKFARSTKVVKDIGVLICQMHSSGKNNVHERG